MSFKEDLISNYPLWKQEFIEYSIATWDRFIEIIKAPANHHDMLWILIPLLSILLLMELYFSRYKSEELGWNTAFGNSLVLIFVSIDLLRYMFNNGQFGINSQMAIVLAIILVGIVFTLFDFFHVLPKSIAFVLSSRLPINFLALVGVIIVYTGFPIDIITFSAFVLFLLALGLFLVVVHYVTPVSHNLELE